MMGSGIPRLHTERLTLRPFETSDAGRVAELANVEEIAANTLNIPHPYETEMAVEWIAEHAEMFTDGRGINFAITIKETGLLIGAIGLVLHQDHSRGEMGYWVGKPYWNNDYATEAAVMIIEFAFDHLHLERVYAHHFSTNPASGRVLVKSGMRHEGTLRRHIKKWGRFQDLQVFGILEDEWRAG